MSFGTPDIQLKSFSTSGSSSRSERNVSTETKYLKYTGRLDWGLFYSKLKQWLGSFGEMMIMTSLFCACKWFNGGTIIQGLLYPLVTVCEIVTP